jgi:MraZ protein
MFIGEYHHTLDDKGRISIPVKFRADLAQGAVVTRGLDRSLFLYTKLEWDKLASKLANLPLGQADTRAFARFMLAGAMEAEIDASGRVTIPPYLRTYASLTKDVVLTGVHDRIELWDEGTWDQYRSKTEAEGDAIAQRLGEYGV